MDKQIILDMAMTEGDAHYRRYLTDRFVVTQVHEKKDGELCAHIFDQETGMEIKGSSGTQLADGTIEVTEDGVIYMPPRADVEPFVLPSSQEMQPIGNHLARRKRGDLDNILRQEHMMMPYDDENDTMIIVLSHDPEM